MLERDESVGATKVEEGGMGLVSSRGLTVIRREHG